MPPPPQEDLSRSAAGDRNPWLVAVVISIATFMEVLDASIANVSLRNIAGSLAAGLDESTWVLTSYLVANAIILPISGWLSRVIGRKRIQVHVDREPEEVRRQVVQPIVAGAVAVEDRQLNVHED